MTDALQWLAPALADVLVRFVWQGAAIGVLAWAALALLRNARPQARYAVACLALLSCVIVPVGGLLQALAAVDAAAPGDIAPSLPFVAAMADAGRDARPFALPEPVTPWIVIAWAAGVLVLSLRMVCGLLWASRLRHAGDDDAGGPWQHRVDRLALGLGIARPVALRLVPGEGSPLTAGWLRPVVLLPVAVATRMPVDLVEALLAHELAHVRRHDYLVNVLQGAAEALLFYHPAVWWLSHRIRVERELVADDLAAGALGDRRRLALALSELERFVPERPEAFPAHLAPAAHGGQLMSRIQQLIRPQRRSAGALIALPLVGIALAGAAFYAQAHLAAQHDVAAPAAAATPAPAPAPAPEPAKPEYNLIPKTLLKEGGEAPKIDVYYVVSKVDSSGGKGDSVESGYNDLKVSVEPGDYIVTATSGNATAEQKISVAADKVAEPVLILNAGALNIRALPSPGAEPDGDAQIIVDYPGEGESSANFGTVKTVVPAGDTKVTVKLGAGEASETISVAAGQSIDKDIIVGVGKAKANAVYAEGGEKVDSGDLSWKVLKATKKIDGTRDQVTYGYGEKLQTTLAAGDYVVVTNFTTDKADSETPFTVKAGERTELAVK